MFFGVKFGNHPVNEMRKEAFKLQNEMGCVIGFESTESLGSRRFNYTFFDTFDPDKHPPILEKYGIGKYNRLLG